MNLHWRCNRGSHGRLFGRRPKTKPASTGLHEFCTIGLFAWPGILSAPLSCRSWVKPRTTSTSLSCTHTLSKAKATRITPQPTRTSRQATCTSCFPCMLIAVHRGLRFMSPPTRFMWRVWLSDDCKLCALQAGHSTHNARSLRALRAPAQPVVRAVHIAVTCSAQSHATSTLSWHGSCSAHAPVCTGATCWWHRLHLHALTRAALHRRRMPTTASTPSTTGRAARTRSASV